MYRKYVVILLAFVAGLVPAVLSAQTETRWGITAGGIYNEIHFKQSDILKVDRKLSPSVGLTGEMNIPGIGFSLDASLLYSMRGSKVHFGEYKAWSSLGLGNTNVWMHNIDIPINLKFKWHRMGGLEDKIQPMVYAGPMFSFNVANNQKACDYKTLSVLLRFGVGMELWRRVQITGGYNFSIGETLRTRLLDQNVAKNRFWNVSVTYFFKAGQIN